MLSPGDNKKTYSLNGLFVGLVLKKSFLVLGRPNCLIVITALVLVLKWLLSLDPESMFDGFVNVPFLNKLLFSIFSKLYNIISVSND